jgi:twitching motility protein PilT
MAGVDILLQEMKEQGASDLHLGAGIRPLIRLHGELIPVEGWEEITGEDLTELLQEIVTEKQWRRYEKTSDIDLAYGLEGTARFRVNFFVQERGPAAVFRLIPEEIVSLEELNLAPAVERLAHLNRGLVLVTGPTGSGKSTTLAAIVDQINRSYARHIVTIEDPIEFVHRNRESIISHREIGSHTRGFGAALRGAIRQDADVILVGELREYETIALAITAAEMGLLVFGTLHTNGAAKTIDRIIDAFPAEEQAQARLSLSESLAAVVAQLLVPTADGSGRCAVNEILLKTPGLPNVIREGKIAMIESIIQSGRAQGMQSMDDALFELMEQGRVRPYEAYLKAQDKARFESHLPPD